jgi:phosphoglycerol transferase
MLFGVLPKIMQDEYVYSSQARNTEFGEHRFSNYLFSWVMSSTEGCSALDFYTCSKSLNAIMFVIGVIFTFLIAARYLEFRWAIFAASVTALSPLAIQVSFFMPETMYFMAMTITTWLALRAADTGKFLAWTLVGVALGATSLVKPHAIFLLPALVIFALLIELRRENGKAPQAVGLAVTQLAAFLGSKLLIGLALAGEAGLRIFGGYPSPIQSATRVIENRSINGAVSPGGEAGRSSFETFVSVATSHFFAHAAVIALVAGIPLVLALRVLVRVVKTKEPVGQASALPLLVALTTGSLMLLVPAFEGYVTATGDDHSVRLILRYYEFLFPMFLIVALVLAKFVAPSRTSRFIQAWIVSLSSLAFVVTYPLVFESKFVDSSFLVGFHSASALFIAVVVVVVIANFVWASDPNRGSAAISFVAIPVLLVTSMISSQELLVRTTSVQAPFGYAGQVANQLLTDTPGKDIVVVGNERPQVFTAKFWIDKADTGDLLLAPGSPLPSDSDLISSYKYLVLVGDARLSGNFKILVEEPGFLILEIAR